MLTCRHPGRHRPAVRVLLINDSARPHNGGMNRVVVETCDWLARAGHTVGLVYQDEGPVEVTCPTFALPEGGTPEAFRAQVESFQPDVIQIHYVRRPGLLTEAAALRPSCVFLHDQTWFCPSGDRMDRWFNPCHRPHSAQCLFWNYAQGCGGKHPVGNWQRWRRTEALSVLKTLDRVRLQVASRFMQQGLEENGYQTSRVDLVPLFADPPVVPAQTEPGLLLLPSRLAPGKGVDLALRAMAGLKDVPWKLVIAGHGNQRGELQRESAALGLTDRVTFLGEISPTELHGWYARAQLVLFPVIRREPFGLIGVEAMAHGRPIVAFQGGAVDEWLTPGVTGLGVVERTPAAFGAAVRTLLTAPERCREMGTAARQHYAQFHPTAYVERLLESFRRTQAGAR
ncbi:MAG: glycosyltransferase family 4 protein [Verrucomicrobia bacterium]|nr:glycosyltransferase family 4 protein [Verrucomicrobiota bacterium]